MPPKVLYLPNTGGSIGGKYSGSGREWFMTADSGLFRHEKMMKWTISRLTICAECTYNRVFKFERMLMYKQEVFL